MAPCSSWPVPPPAGRVLPRRIARLLESSRDERFRILALTFTNKAAHERAHRVTALAPGLEGLIGVGKVLIRIFVRKEGYPVGGSTRCSSLGGFRARQGPRWIRAQA